MSEIEIEIDGQLVKANQGDSIINIADREGIEVPRFCYHKKLSVAANCRMCLVDVEGVPKAQPACSTPAANGMKINTKNDKAKFAQKAVMEFLLINHPLDCPICDQGGECELQDVAMEYGSDVSKFNEGKRIVPDKGIGALIQTDMTRCIHCTRCVRFGAEVAGIVEMGGTGRGEGVKIEPFLTEGIQSELSGNIRTIFAEYAAYEDEISKNDDKKKAELAVELFVLVLLIFALAFHIAEVGIIGLGVIILLTSFKGITHEHYLGDAFKEALPFTALLCVFFAIVSVIHEQHLFTPVINYVLTFSIESQTSIFFIANGVLSAISDNVFVATIYINEVKALLDAGKISLEHFNNLTIAINTGTNIPSIATPNGQAAFLFLLTSSLAPLINLSYFRMVLMALPYTIVLTIVALISVYLFI